MLRGLSLIDLSLERMRPQLGGEPVQLVALAPGHDVTGARQALVDTGAPTSDLGVLDGPSALLSAVGAELGMPSAARIDDLVLGGVDRLTWPRLFLVELRDDAPGTLRAARELASATRDLAGPLRFLLLLPAEASWPSDEMPAVWAPLHAAPHPLPFHLGRPLRSAGFDIYLGCRLYWEAAGRSGHLRAFQDLWQRAPELMMAADADARIDRALDEGWARISPPPGPLCEILWEAFGRTAARKILRGGIMPPSSIPVAKLERAGICWRPPGSLHALITPQAAFQFARGAKGLDADERSALQRAARQNQLLGAWVLGLTSHVEREMVRRGQGCTEEQLRACGLLEKLRGEQVRNPPHLSYNPSSELIDYASFGELILLSGHRLPVSRHRLEEARHTRNLAAHLRPVSWRAVHGLLELLEQLGVG